MNGLPLLASVALLVADPGSIAAMKWERRVLLISAPSAKTAELAAQRRIIARWKDESAARDLSIVEVVAQTVSGANDTAAALRKTYRLPATGFAAILIGKDGGEKLRSAHPIPAIVLERTIDAMPMRQAGKR
ncbi:hypothetical protein ASG11_05620 [Sphingomonas sp. Leaf357]|uniref:DUF4174 domain-containing protein n=1 Tax=Sphingomonas sp. Leaf357 TaxID=1736350 RepID=UPI0006FCCE46|nr:DUF4174 domain-containing protein [Sphingomonas sp. Leaf357]KQS03787.1 hypothetical protein ASG11_05620 [Sphingomonas sp. Leaf357]